MPLYLNCDDNPVTFNKKNYLLRAAEQLNLGGIREWTSIVGADAEYLLNIEPCTIRKGKKWTGFWHIDPLLDYTYDYSQVDTVFVAATQLKKPYDKAILLFQAIDPLLHRRMPEIKQEYDFVFCGSAFDGAYRERVRILTLLKEKYSYHEFQNGRPAHEYINSLNTAKVQFIRSMGNETESGELAQRFFECLAIGPVLTNHVDDLKHTGLIEGEDYMSYTDDYEMTIKLNLLLGDENLRNKIAENGRRKAVLYHTYAHRVMSLLQYVKYNFTN